MHELDIVEALVKELLQRLVRDEITRVEKVHVERSVTFLEYALRQAFEIFAAGTPLEGVQLIVDVQPLEYACPCGHVQSVDPTNLFGKLYPCPSCGLIQEIDTPETVTIVDIVSMPEESDGA